MTTYSFHSTATTTATTATEVTPTYAKKGASPKQIEMYTDICKRTGTPMKNISEFTGQSIYAEIEQLRKLPVKASDLQIEKIKSLYADLENLGRKMKPLTDELLNGLTGGKDGTASELITKMQTLRTKMNAFAPITDEQTKRIVEWYFCPDIPFESMAFLDDDNKEVIVTVEKRILLDTEEGKVQRWRLMTPDEFAQELKAKLTQRQANKLIDQYRGVFYDWKKTRITAKQYQQIRTLEDRMANLYSPKAVEVAFTFDLDEDAVTEYTYKQSSLKDEYNPNGYVPLEESAIIQYSVQEASKHIDLLNHELTIIREFGSYIDNSQTQQEFTEKHSSYNERNRTGLAKDQVTARVQEFTALQDFTFKLDSMTGNQSDELRNLLKDSILDNDDQQTLVVKEMLHEILLSTIDYTQPKDKILNNVGSLYILAEDTEIGISIVNNVASEVYSNLQN